jgi:hypothetical protein
MGGREFEAPLFSAISFLPLLIRGACWSAALDNENPARCEVMLRRLTLAGQAGLAGLATLENSNIDAKITKQESKLYNGFIDGRAIVFGPKCHRHKKTNSPSEQLYPY